MPATTGLAAFLASAGVGKEEWTKGEGSTWLLQECADPVILETRGLRRVPRLQAEAYPEALGPSQDKGLAKAMDNLTCRIGVMGGSLLNHLQRPRNTRSMGEGRRQRQFQAEQ